MSADSDASTEPEPINLDQACEMFGGDRELLRSIVEAFLIETPGLIKTIDSAMQVGDATAVFRAAHTMKSNFNNLCLPEAAQQCLEIEVLAKQGELAEVEARLDLFRGRLQTVIAQVKDCIAS